MMTSRIHKDESGATIIEMLVAVTLIFIAVTVALRLQIVLAENLGTRHLNEAVRLADSLMVSVANDVEAHDTEQTVEFAEEQLYAMVSVHTDSGLRAIRIDLYTVKDSTQIHTLYYEAEAKSEQ